MPNVLPLDHTPSRGIPLQDDRPTIEVDAPSKRSRTITGKLFRSRDGDAPAPTWLILVATLLVGSGGTATASSMFSPTVDPDRVTGVEVAVAQSAAKDAEHTQAIAAVTAKIEALDQETAAETKRLWAEQIRTSRWMAGVLQDQSGALAAIASKLDVDVDLALPPLVIGEPAEAER